MCVCVCVCVCDKTLYCYLCFLSLLLVFVLHFNVFSFVIFFLSKQNHVLFVSNILNITIALGLFVCLFVVVFWGFLKILFSLLATF